jgi:hypothetical protein
MAALMNSDVVLWGAELWVWMEAHPLLVLAISVVLLAPGVICVVAARRGEAAARAGLNRIDDRLTQIHRAVELLTDTTESAFGITFAEIERISEEAGVRASHRAAMRHRVAAAANEGLSPREIALTEGVSEGEIRLRLRLQDTGTGEEGGASGPGGEIHGSDQPRPANADQAHPLYQTH